METCRFITDTGRQGARPHGFAFSAAEPGDLAFLPADSVSSPCGLMAGWCGRVTIRETDCVAGHIGFELRCAERKFISLGYRVSSDLRGAAQTAAIPRENDLLC